MLSLALVEEIDRLLQDGRLSQRKIAARLGVGRGTVSAIANGHRGLFGREPQGTRHEPSLRPSLHGEPSVRCPRCGFKVYLPCLVCRTREYRDAQKVRRELAELQGRTQAGRKPGRPARAKRRRRPRVA